MAVFNTLKYQGAKYIIRNATQRRLPLSRQKIRRLIQKILKREQGALCRRSISIVFLSDQAIRKVNRRYLKDAAPTDVLSFDYGDNGAELLISLDTAQRNALSYRTSPEKEIMLYIIHGLLHLLGYDDTNSAAKRRMFKKQEEIFRIITNQFCKSQIAYR